MERDEVARELIVAPGYVSALVAAGHLHPIKVSIPGKRGQTNWYDPAQVDYLLRSRMAVKCGLCSESLHEVYAHTLGGGDYAIDALMHLECRNHVDRMATIYRMMREIE